MNNEIEDERKLKREINLIKQEEESKKNLLVEEKQPLEPLPVGEGHETEVLEADEKE